MIEEFWNKLTSFKLSTGDALMVGSFIGFLSASLWWAPFSAMYQSENLTLTMAMGQWIYATSFATAYPWMLLFCIGVFLKGVESDDWKTKVIGAFILYWALRFLIWEIVTVKPYVIALKPM